MYERDEDQSKRGRAAQRPLPIRRPLPVRGARPERPPLPAQAPSSVAKALEGQLPRPNTISYEIARGVAVRRIYRVPPLPTTAQRKTDAGSRWARLARRLQPHHLAWLLGLVALGGALLLFLMLSSGHRHAPLQQRPAPLLTSSPPQSGTRFGVTMPAAGGGTRPVPPLALLLVVPHDLHNRTGELRRLGQWITEEESPRSRTRVLTVTGERAWLTRPLAGSALGHGPDPQRTSPRAVEPWLTRHRHRGFIALVVTVEYHGRSPKRIAGITGTLRGTVNLLSDSPVPSATEADPGRRGALAAATALQILRAADQQVAVEPRSEELPAPAQPST